MSTKPIVITPEANIVGGNTAALKNELSELINSGQLEITLDMKQVEMVDSLGIGILIAARNSLQRVSGKISIVNLSDNLTRLFSNMRIIDLLNVS